MSGGGLVLFRLPFQQYRRALLRNRQCKQRSGTETPSLCSLDRAGRAKGAIRDWRQ